MNQHFQYKYIVFLKQKIHLVMPRRRRNQSTTSDEPQSQRSRHQSPTNDSESLRNMLTEEEYQMSLQAENAFLERQRQIEGKYSEIFNKFISFYS